MCSLSFPSAVQLSSNHRFPVFARSRVLEAGSRDVLSGILHIKQIIIVVVEKQLVIWKIYTKNAFIFALTSKLILNLQITVGHVYTYKCTCFQFVRPILDVDTVGYV